MDNIITEPVYVSLKDVVNEYTHRPLNKKQYERDIKFAMGYYDMLPNFLKPSEITIAIDHEIVEPKKLS